MEDQKEKSSQREFSGGITLSSISRNPSGFDLEYMFPLTVFNFEPGHNCDMCHLEP